MKDRSRLDDLRTRALSSRWFAMLGCVQIFSQNAFAQSTTQSAAVAMSAAPMPSTNSPVPVTASSLLRSITTLGPRVRYRLANGLDVILEENHRLPQVAVDVVFRVGSRDNPPRFTGLAHTVEHMMFERAARGQQRYWFAVASLGAEYNAFTYADRTEYVAVVPSEQAQALLWLEADRMAYLLRGLNEQPMASVQRAIRNEFRLRVESDELSPLRTMLLAALYPQDHPYRSNEEVLDDLQAIGLPEVQWFFQRWYTPANATVVVVGDFDTGAMRAVIERYFSPIVSHAPPSRPTPPVAAPQRNAVSIATQENHELVALVWPTPAFLTDEDAALDVIADMMTAEMSDSVSLQMQHRFGRDAMVHAAQISLQLQSEFALTAAVPLDRSPQEMLPELTAAVSKIRRELVSQDDLQVFRRRQIARLAEWQESNSGRAERLALYSLYTQQDADLTAFDADRYTRLTPEIVRRTARHWLSHRNRVEVVIQRASRQLMENH